MKALILSALVCLGFVSPAMAASLGKAEPVLEVVIAGGMPVPGGHFSEQITLDSHGQVTLVETRYPLDFSGKPVVTKNQVFLVIKGNSFLTDVKQTIEYVKGGELVSSDPDAPECMDAPGTSYFAYKNGQRIQIGATWGCIFHHLADEDQRWAADKLINTLNDFFQYR